MAAKEQRPPAPPISARLGQPVGFRPEHLDFDRGIRVGNLEEHERITRILKLALESRYGQPFVTERYGRGAYWQWIGFLPRANRSAKPLSSSVSFGCAKFFLMVDTELRQFQCGLQVERGYATRMRGREAWRLAADWDWHRLVRSLGARGPMRGELERLLADGFRIFGGTWSGAATPFSRDNFPGVTRLRELLRRAEPREWAGFKLYYPMSEKEVRGSTGVDLVEAMLAVFAEVTPAMNHCMQIRLEEVQR